MKNQIKKKYTAIQKMTDNPFLNLYQMDAITDSGLPFSYYFASRNDENKLKLKTKSMHPEGIVIYPVLIDKPDILVMIKQYRYPLDEWIYELPAGLVEEYETPEQAAIREMKEETGLDFTVYTGGDSSFRRPLFLGAGMTDEMSTTVFGYAKGSVSKEFLEDSESINVVLVDKKEARRILSEERVSLRCGLLLMSFLQMKADAPFSFLDC